MARGAAAAEAAVAQEQPQADRSADRCDDADPPLRRARRPRWIRSAPRCCNSSAKRISGRRNVCRTANVLAHEEIVPDTHILVKGDFKNKGEKVGARISLRSEPRAADRSSRRAFCSCRSVARRSRSG